MSVFDGLENVPDGFLLIATATRAMAFTRPNAGGDFHTPRRSALGRMQADDDRFLLVVDEDDAVIDTRLRWKRVREVSLFEHSLASPGTAILQQD